MPIAVNRQADKVIYIGVDPGAGGGLVSIAPLHPPVCTPMPDTELEIWDWFASRTLWYKDYTIKAIIEKVHSMPKQGVASMFSFGQSYGSLRMALTACGAEWQEVTPQTWQKEIGFPIRKGEAPRERKLRLIKMAQQLYPKLELWSQPKTTGKQAAIADALLIARVCQQRNK